MPSYLRNFREDHRQSETSLPGTDQDPEDMTTGTAGEVTVVEAMAGEAGVEATEDVVGSEAAAAAAAADDGRTMTSFPWPSMLSGVDSSG